MTDPVKEQLSACLDGELPKRELDLLLKQIERHPEARGALGRYAAISEALRAPGAVVAPTVFAERVHAAIAAEAPLGAAVSRQAMPRWVRPAAGVAVAAGVAALAIIGLQQPPSDPQATYVAESAATSPARSAASEPESVSYIVPATTTYIPAARLTNYVVAHSEFSTPLGRRSVLSGVLAEEESAAGAIEESNGAGPGLQPSPRSR